MGSKNKEEQFQGVWPAMFTPVNEAGTLNTTELEKLIELLVKEQVDGLYLLGSTGQGFLFSEAQRMHITEATLEIVNKRLPVMVQVGALNTDESVRLAKHAAQKGADGISAVGPIYYGASEKMAIQHYSRIALATDLPFFPYQIGKVTAGNEELIKVLLEIPNVYGMKLTTQNLLEISSIHLRAGNNWKLFSGADELLCHAALCGTAGAIGTTYNLIGSTCKYIRRSFLDGQVMEASTFMLELQHLIEQILPVVWSFFRRAMIVKHGIDIGDPKPPLLPGKLPWSDEEILEMVNKLDRFAVQQLPAIDNH